MNLRRFLFLAISSALYLPLSPFLARFGLAICPILHREGFWFGCELNFKFIVFLLAGTSVTAMLLSGSVYRRWMARLIPAFAIPFSLILFQFFSGAFLLYAIQQLQSAVGDVTALAPAVVTVLSMVGCGLIGLQTLMLEVLLSYANRRDFTLTKPSRAASLVIEFYTLAQLIAIPTLVLALHGRLTVFLADAGIEGWASPHGQNMQLVYSGAALIVWFICMNLIAVTGRWLLIQSLVHQAEALLVEDVAAVVSLERLGWLEPLGHALNKSAQILAQKKRLTQGFSKFVSSQLVRQVVEKNQVELFGQQVFAGILMTDLRDFTSLSENLQPREVVRLLNLYFEDMIDVLNSHSIMLDKFIGDGLLAYLPCDETTTPETAATHLFQAGREMLKRLETTNQKLAREGLPPLKLGIGLHLGEVVLGAMGSSVRMQYTIIGDAVNRTARLESLSKSLGSNCVASRTFYDALPASMAAEFRGPLLADMKGIQHQVEVFALNEAANQRKTG
jgi:class 3 adenylate cyclase